MLQAFTLTDDHALQEQVWNQLPAWNRSARTIRHMLSTNAIPATDKRVRFVGLATYEADAGLVRRDLFADDEQGIDILDPAKLTRLVNEKLQSLAAQAEAEGWKWVEINPENDSQTCARLRRLAGEEAPLSAKDEAKLKKLTTKREALENNCRTTTMRRGAHLL
jgi:ParB family transcriptional regulator, chromosome partitioning protein